MQCVTPTSLTITQSRSGGMANTLVIDMGPCQESLILISIGVSGVRPAVSTMNVASLSCIKLAEINKVSMIGRVRF